MRGAPWLAIQRSMKLGSQSSPGTGDCVGAGARPRSKTIGMYEPPCEVASGTPATRDERYRLSVKPMTAMRAPQRRRNSTSLATLARSSSALCSRLPGLPMATMPLRYCWQRASSITGVSSVQGRPEASSTRVYGPPWVAMATASPRARSACAMASMREVSERNPQCGNNANIGRSGVPRQHDLDLR